MEKVILASNNMGKIKEFREILKDMDIELVSMKEAGIDVDIEEYGRTFSENALIKARTISEMTGCVTLADDSGLEVDWLNKEPGVHSARFMGHDTPYEIKNQAIIDKLKGVIGSDRSARFVTHPVPYISHMAYAHSLRYGNLKNNLIRTICHPFRTSG